MADDTVEIELTFEKARSMIEAATLAKSRMPEDCSEALSLVSFKLGEVFGSTDSPLRATVSFTFSEARAIIRAAKLANDRLPEQHSEVTQAVSLALQEASEQPLTMPQES